MNLNKMFKAPINNYHSRRASGNKGAALLISVLFFLIISVTLVVGSVGTVITTKRISRNLIESKSSYFTSEAGIEDALYRIKKNKQISNPEVTALNGGTASIVVTDSGGGEKEITSTGDISSNTRKIKASVTTGEGFDFFYGAQVGEGGLVMQENSQVQGVGGAVGNVYSNGTVTGYNNAKVTGSLTVATSAVEDVQARSLVCNQDQIVGQTDPQIDFAQSFIASDSLPLYKISLYIKKIETPSSQTIRIVDNVSGSPGENTLAIASLSSSLVTSSYGWVDVAFSSPASLVEGETYWIVLDTDEDDDEYYIWCKDSNNGFGNGIAKYREDWDDGSAWSSPITGDLTFKTYIGGGPGIIDNVDVLVDARANTITNSAITGIAYCQTGSGNNKACDTSQPDPSITNMPISQGNIDQWKSDATAGDIIVGNCGNGGVDGCNILEDGTLSLGPKKIVGNLVLDNKRHLNITGVLYFTGSITISNSSSIKCDASFGSNSCMIVTDGPIRPYNNATFTGSGQTGSYLMMLSTVQGCNGGLQQPECTDGNAGIYLDNNVTGAIFYTTDSMIFLDNNVNIKEAIGYKMYLNNGAIIRYESGLINADFSSGPSGGWNIKSWKEIE
ncbi:MAG: hypothetical protein HW401_133 [Parcubacteria group bacterium]|nr:hypothetical protein [Parcubacteria group bacterium]